MRSPVLCVVLWCLGCLMQTPALAGHRYMDLRSQVHLSDAVLEVEVHKIAPSSLHEYATEVELIIRDTVVLADGVPSPPEQVVLHYPGGRQEDAGDWSHPKFHVGERLLIFTALPSDQEMAYLVGGARGIYVIEQDGSGGSVPMTRGGRGIMDVVDGLIHPSPTVTGWRGEKARFRPAVMGPPPISDRTGEPALSLALPETGRLLGLEAFKDAIRHEWSVGWDGELKFRPESTIFQATTMPPIRSSMDRVDDLCGCGSHYLPLVFQLRPASEDSWEADQHAMWIFNQYMDIFRVQEHDGASETDNDQNELWGFYSSWPEDIDPDNSGAVGVCWNLFWPGCGEGAIQESDIGFLEDNWAFTQEDIDNDPTAHDYRHVILHELGHSVGIMTGDCPEESYEYTRNTVMKASGPGDHGNGRGLHPADVYLLRYLYESQISVIPIHDVGCERYAYVDGQSASARITLPNSNLFVNTLEPGDTIWIRNVSFENMSTVPTTAKVTIYLTHDNDVDEFDVPIDSYTVQLPNYYEWSGILEATIPDDISGGRYNIGIEIEADDSIHGPDTVPGNDSVVIKSLMDIEVVTSCHDPILVEEGDTSYDNWGTHVYQMGDCGSDLIRFWYPVWFEYTPPYDGTASFIACGGNFDTVISVHDAADCGTAQPPLYCSEDGCVFLGMHQGSVEGEVEAGRTYHVRIASQMSGHHGSGVLTIALDTHEANDVCTSPAVVGVGTHEVDLTASNTEGWKPVPCSYAHWGSMFNDRWYEFTAPTDGILEVDFCGSTSGLDTVCTINLPAHCSIWAQDPLACSDNSWICSEPVNPYLQWAMSAGETVHIRVGTPIPGDVVGSVQMSIDFDPTVYNDTCDEAAWVGVESIPFVTTNADTELPPGATNCGFDQVHNDVWFKLAPECSGMLTIECEADFSVCMSVYREDACWAIGPEDIVACSATGDLVAIPYQRNASGIDNVLHVRVGGVDPAQIGTGLIDIRFEPGGFDHDVWSDAQNYFPTGSHLVETGCHATDGVPVAGCGQIHHDRWYEFTATSSGVVSFTTCGASEFDVAMALYRSEGTEAPSDANLIVCGSDTMCGLDPSTDVHMTARVFLGRRYLLRVGGQAEGELGSVTVTRSWLDEDSCLADMAPTTGDGVVDVLDLLEVLQAWGTNSNDRDLDGVPGIDINDLLVVFGEWGPCGEAGCSQGWTCAEGLDAIEEHPCSYQGGRYCVVDVNGDSWCVSYPFVPQDGDCDCPPGSVCIELPCAAEPGYYCAPLIYD